MAEFHIKEEDYQRYGLDDSRCSVKRPTGLIKLSISKSEWNIEAKIRKSVLNRKIRWTFKKPLVVRQLFDRFLVHLSHEDIFKPSIMVVIPFSVLSKFETELLKEVAEKRYRKNADGDFYGVADECLCINACIPAEIAPDLISYEEKPENCYFKKQPKTKEEFELAVDAVLSAFTKNLRYGGKDIRVLKKIRANTRNLKLNVCQDDLCDYPNYE